MKKLKESIKENWKFFLFLFFGWFAVSTLLFGITVYLFAKYPDTILGVIIAHSLLSGFTVLLIIIIIRDRFISLRIKIGGKLCRIFSASFCMFLWNRGTRWAKKCFGC